VEELKMRLVRDTIFKVFLTMHGFEQMTREEFVALQRKARRHKLVHFTPFRWIVNNYLSDKYQVILIKTP